MLVGTELYFDMNVNDARVSGSPPLLFIIEAGFEFYKNDTGKTPIRFFNIANIGMNTDMKSKYSQLRIYHVTPKAAQLLWISFTLPIDGTFLRYAYIHTHHVMFESMQLYTLGQEELGLAAADAFGQNLVRFNSVDDARAEVERMKNTFADDLLCETSSSSLELKPLVENKGPVSCKDVLFDRMANTTCYKELHFTPTTKFTVLYLNYPQKGGTDCTISNPFKQHSLLRFWYASKEFTHTNCILANNYFKNATAVMHRFSCG